METQILEKTIEEKRALDEIINEKRNTIKGDRLDMSFGEIMNIYEDEELIISPEYQRAYRWSEEQKTGFIESILLGIPVPPIFVAEDDDGKWELVDGLQRTSTILSFFRILKDSKKNNLTLQEGSIIKHLNGVNERNASHKFKNIIKRAICRVEILRWNGSIDMRYELFNRLNTTSSPLTHQEIRNCIFRSYGNKFNEMLKEIADTNSFNDILTLSKKQKIEMFGEELILRVFCFQEKYNVDKKDSLNTHLTKFMEKSTKWENLFNVEKEKQRFMEVLKKLHKDYFRVNGLLSIRLWDAILYVLYKAKNINEIQINDLVNEVKKNIEERNINRTFPHHQRPKEAIKISINVAKQMNINIE